MSREVILSSHPDAITEPLPIVGSTPDDEPDIVEGRERLPLKFPAIMLLAGMALGTGIVNAPSIQHNFEAATDLSDRNNDMSDLATEIAGIPLRVDCDDAPLDKRGNILEDGVTYTVQGQVTSFLIPYTLGTIAPPVMTVRESICDDILTFDTTPPTTDTQDPAYFDYLFEAQQFAGDVGVVLHEAEHNKQIFNEAEANCYSYQKLPGALVQLGMDPQFAEEVSLRAAVDEERYSTDEYISEECMPGGEYDLAISPVYLDPNDTQDMFGRAIGKL
jgi:hypothetical protein